MTPLVTDAMLEAGMTAEAEHYLRDTTRTGFDRECCRVIIAAALSALPAAPTQGGGWVKIDPSLDRSLPDENAIVVWGYSGETEADTYIGTMLDERFDLDAWTHWHALAPLPPPPKEDA